MGMPITLVHVAENQKNGIATLSPPHTLFPGRTIDQGQNLGKSAPRCEYFVVTGHKPVKALINGKGITTPLRF